MQSSCRDANPLAGRDHSARSKPWRMVRFRGSGPCAGFFFSENDDGGALATALDPQAVF